MSLYNNIPDTLAPFYRQFNVEHRLLLNGQSHQAWPDCALLGLQDAWNDAASQLDKKWSFAEIRADNLRQFYAQRLYDLKQNIALGQNTHQLLVMLLSALPLNCKPRIVTSDSEFASAHRQLRRLAEAGIEISYVSTTPYETFTQRFIEAINQKTCAAILSHTFYNSARVVDNVGLISQYCSHNDCAFILDVYHSLNVIPLNIHTMGLEQAYIMGGGYKYCQFGEGNCFLRLPSDCELRPIITGWFSEFLNLEQSPSGPVHYGIGGQRFCGATYDPVSHYRASRVIDFFAQQQLDDTSLHTLNKQQLDLLYQRICDASHLQAHLSFANSDFPDNNGGFMALKTDLAEQLVSEMSARGVACDSRGDILRLGPAPYVNESQLHRAMDHLEDACKQLLT